MFRWNEHNTLFARYLRLPYFAHIALFFVVSIAVLSPTLFSFYKNYQQINQLEEQCIEQETLLAQQKQRLTNLQRRFEKKGFTPQLTQQIAILNETVQLLSQGMSIHSSEWSFQSEPYLRLQLQSNFTDFRRFLTALLTQSKLDLLALELKQAEDIEQGSILSDVILLLPRNALLNSEISTVNK